MADIRVINGKRYDNIHSKGNIVAERIKEARLSRCMSQAELSKITGVSPQVISLYEKGDSKPSPSVLIKIIEELNFPMDFFFQKYDNDYNEEDNSIIFFRSNKSRTKKLENACEVKIKWVERVYNILKSYFYMPEINIPDLNITDYESLDDNDIENITLKLREYWNLGEAPIGNLISMLQKNGFVISRIEVGSKKVDAFSKWIGDVPYIFLGSDKDCAVRSRFDLAHELGHLILHKNINFEDIKEMDKLEEQANRFASAFLLPIESFNREVYSSSIDGFLLLKKRWKVSMSAMIRRCLDTEILTDNQVRYLKAQMTQNGYWHREPLDDTLKIEKPYLFKQAFEVLLDKKIFTKDTLLDSLKLNKQD
ncbi:MAG: ImmA/IrrE family metallo-endopeptidase, partial [Clostridioides sp.]|nr:ImmA/IrrE family metallo-endopeptidase [Clostridioides sp.]